MSKKQQKDPSHHCQCRQGLSRRRFLTSIGVGAMAAAIPRNVSLARETEEMQILQPKKLSKIQLRINGRTHELLVEPRWTLLSVLRDHLGMTGTKLGCGRGECGACTVLIDNIPRYSCLTLAVEAENVEITTLEGLMQGEELGPVQQSFLDQDAFQCGYCTPGQIVAAEGLLRKNSKPEPDEILRGMSGNLCRCGAYTHIVRAVQDASGKRGK